MSKICYSTISYETVKTYPSAEYLICDVGTINDIFSTLLIVLPIDLSFKRNLIFYGNIGFFTFMEYFAT